MDFDPKTDPFAPLNIPENATAPQPEAKEVWEQIMPAPNEPLREYITHSRHGTPTRHWVYRDAQGAPLFMVLRFDLPDGSKEVLPYSYGRRQWTIKTGKNAGKRADRTGWFFKAPKSPRPLYGLDKLEAKPGATVLLVEGEKAADAANALFFDLIAVTSQGGSKAADRADWQALAGRHVVIWPDHDEAGLFYAQAAAYALMQTEIVSLQAASVRQVDLPSDWPKGWDVADAQPEQISSLREMIDGAAEVSPDDLAKPQRSNNAPLIKVVAGELHNTATQAEAAIIASGLPMYQRGDALVRPVVREVPASRGRKTLAAGLGEMTVHSLIDAMCSTAEWEKFDARSEDWVRINPPAQVAQVLLSRHGRWRFPVVAGIITTPTLRPDGSLLTAEGYDAATRLFHVADASLQLRPSVHAPTREHAVAALGVLEKLLAEFDFVKTKGQDGTEREVSKAVALSGIISPVVRGGLSVVPLHGFNAHAPGSGKSYLVDVISMIAAGRPCPVITAAADEIETEKRIAGLLLAGFPIVSIDNCNGELGGDLLCQAVERPLIRIRRLGASDIIEVESCVSIFATGNNLRVRGDMVRRSLLAELDPQLERPELREFKGNPVAEIQANRGLYVSAALVIVRAYLAAGKPGRLPPIASFEDWSDSVRSALVWLGCADPALSMEQARADDPELGELREVLELWTERLGPEALTTRELADRIETKQKTQMGEPVDYLMPDLRDAIFRIAGERGNVNTKRLGRWLMSKEGRIVGNRRISRSGPASGGIVRWVVRP
jgi:putative DNA primase/helicase